MAPSSNKDAGTALQLALESGHALPWAPQAALIGAARAFASLGRAFICLDPDFRIVHASYLVDSLLGDGAVSKVQGRAVQELLEDDLFGPSGALRQALLAGERREGWRATLRFEGGPPRLVSMSVAPLVDDHADFCGPGMAYIVVMRPAEDEGLTASGTPTFFSGVISSSELMHRIFRLIENLEHSEATVLITGESGVGKEVMARAIHQHSSRRSGPFVAVNCAALPAELLESELFGHARGAFTGAVRDRLGRFELASEGSLFLDEIGDLPPTLQVKLLRVLQERTFERVGESEPRATNARIIAATNVDLRRAMAEGRFRGDLYYRLRVVPIEIPPLRQRREDVQPLAVHLLMRVSGQQGLVKRLSPQAMRAILNYSWPGNVRELANAIEYAVAVSRKETILPEDLPAEVLDMTPTAGDRTERERANGATRTLAQPATGVESDEAARLRAALEACHWRRKETAQALGLGRTTLWRKMRELKLL